MSLYLSAGTSRVRIIVLTDASIDPLTLTSGLRFEVLDRALSRAESFRETLRELTAALREHRPARNEPPHFPLVSVRSPPQRAGVPRAADLWRSMPAHAAAARDGRRARRTRFISDVRNGRIS